MVHGCGQPLSIDRRSTGCYCCVRVQNFHDSCNDPIPVYSAGVADDSYGTDSISIIASPTCSLRLYLNLTVWITQAPLYLARLVELTYSTQAEQANIALQASLVSCPLTHGAGLEGNNTKHTAASP